MSDESKNEPQTDPKEIKQIYIDRNVLVGSLFKAALLLGVMVFTIYSGIWWSGLLAGFMWSFMARKHVWSTAVPLMIGSILFYTAINLPEGPFFEWQSLAFGVGLIFLSMWNFMRKASFPFIGTKIPEGEG